MEKGEASWAEKNYDEANAQVEIALKLRPGNAAATNLQGRASTARAAAKTRAQRQQNSTNLLSFLKTAKSAENNTKWGEAVAAYISAVSLVQAVGDEKQREEVDESLKFSQGMEKGKDFWRRRTMMRQTRRLGLPLSSGLGTQQRQTCKVRHKLDWRSSDSTRGSP